MSDTIIAGLDLDAPDQARDALAFASWLAGASSSDLLLVNVFAPRGGALSMQLEHRRRELETLAGRPVETLTVAGTSPARVLHELADVRRPRALVIGSSRGGATGTVSIGSAGEFVLHGGGGAVAVAPNGFRGPQHPPEIGVAYGVTPESDDAVRTAVEFAVSTGARLRVLHVHEPAPHHELPERHPGEHLERALAGAAAERTELEGDPRAGARPRVGGPRPPRRRVTLVRPARRGTARRRDPAARRARRVPGDGRPARPRCPPRRGSGRRHGGRGRRLTSPRARLDKGEHGALSRRSSRRAPYAGLGPPAHSSRSIAPPWRSPSWSSCSSASSTRARCSGSRRCRPSWGPILVDGQAWGRPLSHRELAAIAWSTAPPQRLSDELGRFGLGG